MGARKTRKAEMLPKCSSDSWRSRRKRLFRTKRPNFTLGAATTKFGDDVCLIAWSQLPR